MPECKKAKNASEELLEITPGAAKYAPSPT